MFTALQLRKLKEEYRDKSSEKVSKIKQDIEDIAKESFQDGFLEGYKVGTSEACFDTKIKIIANLIKYSDMDDKEIYKVVALGEEKWEEHIKYLRENYDRGKEEWREKVKSRYDS